MAAQGERKAQVETPAKMRAGVVSIPLMFDLSRPCVVQTYLIRSARRRPARRLSSLQDASGLHTRRTPQDYALALHRRTHP